MVRVAHGVPGSLVCVLLLVVVSQESARGLTPEFIFNACKGLMSRARGGFAALVLINGYGILGEQAHTHPSFSPNTPHLPLMLCAFLSGFFLLLLLLSLP